MHCIRFIAPLWITILIAAAWISTSASADRVGGYDQAVNPRDRAVEHRLPTLGDSSERNSNQRSVAATGDRILFSSPGEALLENATLSELRTYADGDRYSLFRSDRVALRESGLDGEIYQTDIAVRRTGKQMLELVRHYDPNLSGVTTFGKDWHLLIPFLVSARSEKRIPFRNVGIPEQMVVHNRVTGEYEVLTFSEKRYSIAGYVADRSRESSLVGLFLLSDGSFRLLDKADNEFQFDTSGRLTDMIFANEDRVHFKYAFKRVDADSFTEPPFVLRPVGHNRTRVMNVSIPRTMRLVDANRKTSEIFEFEDDNVDGLIGYVPATGSDSKHRRLALLTNAAFRLETSDGGRIEFGRDGVFEGSRVPIVDKMIVGQHTVAFSYESHQGTVRIRSAIVREGNAAIPSYVARYSYDSNGRLYRVKRPAGGVVLIDYERDSLHLTSSESAPTVPQSAQFASAHDHTLFHDRTSRVGYRPSNITNP